MNIFLEQQTLDLVHEIAKHRHQWHGGLENKVCPKCRDQSQDLSKLLWTVKEPT